MPRTTARDLVTDALRTSGAIAAIETPSAEEINHGLNELNNLVDQWNIQELIPYSNATTTFPTVSGQTVYTIGTVGTEDIDLARPNFLKNVAVNISDTYRPITILNEDEWASYGRSGTSDGVPGIAVLHRGYPEASIELYPVPSEIWTITLTTKTRIANLLLDDLINLPDGFYPALQYALAEIIALQYGTDNYQLVQQQATRMIANIKRMNTKLETLSFNQIGCGNGGDYDIASDSYLTNRR